MNIGDLGHFIDHVAAGALGAPAEQAPLESGPTIENAERLSSVETALARVPKQTTAENGKPGDPVNLVFVGSLDELKKQFAASGWSESRQSVGSDLQYAGAVITHHEDKTAPVSNLKLMGKKQDIAFEQCESTSARHHVRFWQVGTTADGQPIWAGAATHDVGIEAKPHYFDGIVGGIEHHSLSFGQLLPTTHRIDGNIDLERNNVAAALARGGGTVLGSVTGYGGHAGTNGDGVAFSTDGQMTVIVAR